MATTRKEEGTKNEATNTQRDGAAAVTPAAPILIKDGGEAAACV